VCRGVVVQWHVREQDRVMALASRLPLATLRYCFLDDGGSLCIRVEELVHLLRDAGASRAHAKNVHSVLEHLGQAIVCCVLCVLCVLCACVSECVCVRLCLSG
jgi:hypothetical protein